jgi:hypothetical protein
MSSRWYCHDCKKDWLGDENGDNDEALRVWETKYRVDYTFRKNTQIMLTNYMDKVREKRKDDDDD